MWIGLGLAPDPTRCDAPSDLVGNPQGIYKGIFERRTVKAGGTRDDAQLQKLISVFSPDRLRLFPGVMDGNGHSILGGTVVSFSRNKDRNQLIACVNGASGTARGTRLCG